MPLQRRDALRHLIALHRLPTLSDAELSRLLVRFGGVDQILGAGGVPLAACLNRPEAMDALSGYLRSPDRSSVRDQADKDLAWLSASGAEVIALSDPNYPYLLREIADPPPLLYLKGDTTLLDRTQVAMVGSRRPTAAGRETAAAFAQVLADAGVIVTSGMAMGIDSAAHLGALAAKKGATIAVWATGLDIVYPRTNRGLADQIVDRGVVVSEFALGSKPLRSRFPRRNRLISGLTVGVLVVEAALDSGSLITADCALEQNREVFAVPGSIHSPQSKGCHALIRNGAKLVETVADIFEELPGNYPPVAGPASHADAVVLSAQQRALLALIGFEPTPVDGIVARSGLSVQRLMPVLMELELAGYIVCCGGAYTRLPGA